MTIKTVADALRARHAVRATTITTIAARRIPAIEGGLIAMMKMITVRQVPAVAAAAVMITMKMMTTRPPRLAVVALPRVAAIRADGLAIPKVIPKRRAGVGRIPIMAIVAGTVIHAVTRKLPVAAGKTPITAIAAGMAILKAIPKLHAVVGKKATVVSAAAAAAIAMTTIGLRAVAVPITKEADEGGSSPPSFIIRFLGACRAFWKGLVCPHVTRKQCICADKELRANLSEKQIDNMVEDSFPASDPPSTY